MLNFTAPIPLSLYIHLPWCVQKCPYCDFNSHKAPASLPEDAYIAALLADLDENLPLIWGRRLVSIFFGGGTPSLFSPQALEKLLSGIHARIPYGQDLEITLEANPGTVDEARFAGFRQAGINRLSIGVQSLQNEKLKQLGRIHDREYALRAIDSAFKAGFTNFNIDLMHGLPNQSIQDAMADITDALQFQPPHLSWYQLTIEPNTLFHHQPPVLPEEETLWDIQEQGKHVLDTAGLQQYEVSAYSKSGRRCEHNVNYWEFGDYLGIGAGAHSKITDLDQQVIRRHWQVKNPRSYLDAGQVFTGSTQILSERDIIFEFMLNGMRLCDGVSVELFQERTGLDVKIIEPVVKVAREKKLLVEDISILRPTEMGQRFLNDLVSLFLPRNKTVTQAQAQA